MTSEAAGRVGGAGAGGIAPPDLGLEWHVGDALLTRARSVLARGCVLTCAPVGPGELRATVTGTRSWPYEVTVTYRLAAGRVQVFEGECDCPVELDCKHAAAALLHHLGTAAPAGPNRRALVPVDPTPPAPAWENSLTSLLGASLRAPVERERSHTPLALQVALNVPPAPGRYGGAQIRLRPIQYNARHRWVSSGVSWRDVRHAYFTGQYLPPQLDALRGIAAVELQRHPYQSLPPWITLDGAGGSAVWDALADAQQAGVDLLLEGTHTPVALSDDPGEVALDLVRDETLRLTPVVRLGERALDPASVRLVGKPAHGLVFGALVGPRTEPAGIARLRRPLSNELEAMLIAGAISIPGADEDRFLSGFLPDLRRRIPVLSSDRSVPLPAPQPPRAVLTAVREPGHRIGLHWQWQESSGRRREFDDRRGLTAAERSAMRESVAAIVGAVVTPGALPPGALATGSDGPEPLPRFLLEGPECVRFMTRTWPALTSRDDLITELGGPDAGLRYRPAADAPELDFEVVADDAHPARDWFGLAVRITLDGETVPFELLFRALAGAEPMLILPSGTYLELADLDPRWDRLRQLIEESRSMDDAAPGEVRIGRFTASRWEDLEQAGLVGARAARWRDRIRALAVAPAEEAGPLPSGIKAELRDYQRQGLDWLRSRFGQGLGGILADDMGLGKTLQMLGLIAHVRESDPAGPPLLVVAPTSVVGNWVAETARFTPALRVAAVTQGSKRRGRTLAAAVAGADLVITSYQLFRIGNSEFRDLPWTALILDEAQFVKNVQSKGFRCVRDFPAPVTFAVTGTPLENNLMELWGLLSLATPGLFPDSRRFTDFYRIPIERGTRPSADRNVDPDAAGERLAQLRRRIAPFLLRRTKEQVAPELPPKVEQVVDVELSPRHRQVYQRHLQRERQRILGLLRDEKSLEDNRFQILRSLTMLRQLSLDPSLVDQSYRDIPSSKLDVVMDELTQVVGSGHRVLVFSQFTRFLDRARDRLASLGIGHCLLDGRTRDRVAVVQAFRSGSVPVFLISLKAGGFGLNLTEADYCLLLDPWWNPAAEAQAIDRTHRIGQTRSVVVHRYVARNTIEEKVMALQAGKAKLFDDVLGTSGEPDRPGRARLTAEDIRELLS